MPKGFDDCAKNGGKLVTKKLKNNRYLHICYDKAGRAHSGEIKVKRQGAKKSKVGVSERCRVEDPKKLGESLKDLQNHFNSNRA